MTKEGPKAKSGKLAHAPLKKKPAASKRVSKKSMVVRGDFTKEDVTEIKSFSTAIAKLNAKPEKRR
jgi:hypothetical protein